MLELKTSMPVCHRPKQSTMESQKEGNHVSETVPNVVSTASQGRTLEPDVNSLGQSLRGLDALNFLMADTQTGVGPFLAIFLKTVRRYDNGRIGLVMVVGSIAQVIMQTPAGAFIDRTRRKRLVVATAATLVGIRALIGASLSNIGTGLLVKHTSFPVGFLSLAVIAAGAFVFAWRLLPETRDGRYTLVPRTSTWVTENKFC